jgi:hypothetical protein
MLNVGRQIGSGGVKLQSILEINAVFKNVFFDSALI